MTIFAQNEPLTEAELDRLAAFLKGCAGGKAMNVEELDGFFAALVAGPEVVMPSEYLPEVFGGELSDAHEFGSMEEANEIIALLMRHWNDIAVTLSKGDAYLPGGWLLVARKKSQRLANENSPGESWNRRGSRHTYHRPGGQADGSLGGMDAHSRVTAVGDVPERHRATAGI